MRTPTLDELARMSTPEIDALWEKATDPELLSALSVVNFSRNLIRANGGDPDELPNGGRLMTREQIEEWQKQHPDVRLPIRFD